MDLMDYIVAMREFHKREGYYPSLGHLRIEEELRRLQEEAESTESTRQRFVPRKRRRPWK